MSNELKIGVKIAGKYELKELKGRGSFGEVWRAEDTEVGIDMAVKIYISLDQRGQSEFKDEYKVAYGLKHPNILKPTYYSVWNDRPYLVMDYCPSGSVAGLCGNTTEYVIWRFIRDVAAGLEYLHSQEPAVIHQDIKPENILIDGSGRFLITDFGISTKMRSTMRRQSRRNTGAGAIAYMGPERFLSTPLVVLASDIWSLGTSIFELATGELPFMGQGGGMLNAGAQLPLLDNKWSKNLNAVMTACMAKDTWDRPTAGQLRAFADLMMQGKNVDWYVWKDSSNTDIPENDGGGKDDIIDDSDNISGGITSGPTVDINTGSRSKWWIAAGVVIIAATGIWAYTNYSNKEKEEAAAVERYYAILSEYDDLVKSGDAVNYQDLLTAKTLRDSLDNYECKYSYIPFTTGEQLDNKIDEARQKWVASAHSQIDIANDKSAAIQHYHKAALLKAGDDVETALGDLAMETGSLGAYIVVEDAYISGGNLVIEYTGLNQSTLDGVEIQIKIGSHSSVARYRDILPGNHHKIVVDIPYTVSEADKETITLSNRGTAFYCEDNLKVK